MPIIRLISLLLLAVLPSGCGLLSGLFGGPAPEYQSPYLAAMADFSLCETAPDLGERRAAAARLARTPAEMQAVTQPTHADHFYEMARVAAASARCQQVLGQ